MVGDLRLSGCDTGAICECGWVAYCQPCVDGTVALARDRMGIGLKANRAERRRALRQVRKEDKLAANIEAAQNLDEIKRLMQL